MQNVAQSRINARRFSRKLVRLQAASHLVYIGVREGGFGDFAGRARVIKIGRRPLIPSASLRCRIGHEREGGYCPRWLN